MAQVNIRNWANIFLAKQIIGENETENNTTRNDMATQTVHISYSHANQSAYVVVYSVI